MPGAARAFEAPTRQARDEKWPFEDYLHEILRRGARIAVGLRELEVERGGVLAQEPIKYAVAGYGVLSCVIGGVIHRSRTSPR